MFFEDVDEQAGTRPRFDSSMRWSTDCNEHVLEGNADDAAAGGRQSQDGDDAQWSHGPTTFGDAQWSHGPTTFGIPISSEHSSDV